MESLLVLHHDKLLPRLRRNVVNGHVRKGHIPVAVDRPQPQAALVRAQAEVDIRIARPEESFTERAVRDFAAAEKDLLAPAQRLKPSPDGQSPRAREPRGELLGLLRGEHPPLAGLLEDELALLEPGRRLALR